MAIDDTASFQDLTQEEWDAINQHAQDRRGRAQTLSSEHRYDREIQLPAPQPIVGGTDGFIGAADLLRRFGGGDLVGSKRLLAEPKDSESVHTGTELNANGSGSERHLFAVKEADTASTTDENFTVGALSGVTKEELWGGEPVDWSQCVDDEDETGQAILDLRHQAKDIFELRDREIELRDGQILFDDQPRPSGIARHRLRESEQKS